MAPSQPTKRAGRRPHPGRAARAERRQRQRGCQDFSHHPPRVARRRGADACGPLRTLKKLILSRKTGNSCDFSDTASGFRYLERSTENEPWNDRINSSSVMFRRCDSRAFEWTCNKSCWENLAMMWVFLIVVIGFGLAWTMAPREMWRITQG